MGNWKSVEKDIPTAIRLAWYATNGEHDFYCGRGQRGKALAEKTAQLLNAGEMAAFASDPDKRRAFRDKVDELLNAANVLDSAINNLEGGARTAHSTVHEKAKVVEAIARYLPGLLDGLK